MILVSEYLMLCVCLPSLSTLSFRFLKLGYLINIAVLYIFYVFFFQIP